MFHRRPTRLTGGSNMVDKATKGCMFNSNAPTRNPFKKPLSSKRLGFLDLVSTENVL